MTDAAASGPVKVKARVPRRAPPVRRGPENQAAIRALRVQPMLRVGAADDPAEREAETTAERVVAMAAPAAPAEPRAAGGSPPPPPMQRASAEDQPNLDTFETEPAIPAGQEDVEVPPKEDVDATALEPGDMGELESGAPEDTGGESGGDTGEPEAPRGESGGAEGESEGGSGDSAPPPEDQGEAQAARDDGPGAVGPEGGAAPADVAARVAQPGAGRPLPAETRAFMEPRFGADFSDVRLHDAPEDRRAARRIGARAFTLGRRIWLGEGETAADRRLMAHELTHVVQQTRRAPAKAAPAAAARATIRRGYLANKAEKYARHVPGYTLLCVILGKSPITGNRVTRNAENLIGGFLGLLPGGTLIFDRLKETRALQRAFDWVSTRLTQLDITWSRISRLIDKVWDIFPTLSPLSKIKKIFKPLVDDIKTFIREIRDKILEFIVHGALSLAGSWGERVWGVVQQARETISLILDDPLGFAKNLIRAVLRGFGKFKDNIWDHLKKGLLGWLFGALATVRVTIPEKLDFKGLMSLGLQILGLSYDVFRATLVKRLGPGGERKVAFLEKSVEVVKVLAKEGFLGLWQKFLGMIDNFKEIVIGGMQKMVIGAVVTAGLKWLAGLTNPVGGIIRICLAIYDMIVAFLERLDQIRQFVGSIFSSMASIARGQVQAAGDFIERALGAAVPVVISFLAAILGLNTIPQKIREVLDRLRKPVKTALDRLLTFLIKKAKKLLSKLVAKLNCKRKLPGKTFRIGKKKHRVFAREKGRKAEVVVASGTPMTLEQVDACISAEVAKLKDAAAKKEGGEIDAATEETQKDTKDEIKRIDLKSDKESMRGVLKSLAKEIDEAAAAYDKAGKDTDKHPEIDTAADKCLIRAQEPRNPAIEGMTGSHAEVKEATSKPLTEGAKMTWSSFYESDHVIEKQFAKAVLAGLHRIDPNTAKAKRGKEDLVREGPKKKKGGPTTKAKTNAKSLGQVGSKAAGFDKIDEAGSNLPTIAIHREIHKAKSGVKPKEKPEALIDRAANSDDPHATVQAALRDEFGLEAGTLNKLYKADKGAPKEIVKKVGASLKTLSERNAAIYGFSARGARNKAGAAEKAAEAPEGSQSGYTFAPREGEANRPDFRQIEGRGGPYSARNADKKAFGTFGKLIQYDHIIDKDFPLKAKGFAFDQDPLREKIATRAAALAGGEAPRRPQALRGEKLVTGAPALAQYDEENGFAVPIYKPIHDLASQGGYATPSPEAILGTMPDPVIAEAAQAMNAEDAETAATHVTAARSAAARHLGAKFRERTREHSTRVADGYAGQLRHVAEVNPPEYAPKAQKAMAEIANNVAASLRQAEAKTVALIPG